MMKVQTIRAIWVQFGASSSNVWMCRRGARLELRIVRADPVRRDTVKVGNYNSNVLFDHFVEDVREVERQMEAMGVGDAA